MKMYLKYYNMHHKYMIFSLKCTNTHKITCTYCRLCICVEKYSLSIIEVKPMLGLNAMGMKRFSLSIEEI